MIKRTATATIALALLAACQAKEEPIAIDDSGNAAATDVETLPPSDSNEVANAAQNAATLPALIPAQYQGRWGMVAADCEPGRSDAKGLITVDPTTMRFYEARATLKEQRPAAAAASYSGLFAFSGEGMTWEKVETLTVKGDTLIREDKDGAFTYQRCA